MAAQIIASLPIAGREAHGCVMPKILNEGQDAGSELGQQVMVEVIQRHKDEIDRQPRFYHEEHPASAPQQ